MKYDIESLKKKNGEQIIASTDPIHLKLIMPSHHTLRVSPMKNAILKSQMKKIAF
jgi:hypothetical protein